jgi:AraC-like DNA-binding protein
VLSAGDVLIWNNITPMSFEVIERVRSITVTIPLSRLRNWLPTSWHSIKYVLPRADPLAEMLAAVIRSVSPAYLAGTLQNSEALTEIVVGLLVSALDTGKPSGPVSLRETQLMLAKRYINENLTDPNLSPSAIAEAKRISIRYLHTLFEADQISVQQYIIRERLLRCRRDLLNPAMSRRTITDIAFSWGFQSSTHFGRRFKTEFGVSPMEFRSTAASFSNVEPIPPRH